MILNERYFHLKNKTWLSTSPVALVGAPPAAEGLTLCERGDCVGGVKRCEPQLDWGSYLETVETFSFTFNLEKELGSFRCADFLLM